jgi:hypothetical protein
LSKLILIFLFVSVIAAADFTKLNDLFR